jgi:hypothetical protein
MNHPFMTFGLELYLTIVGDWSEAFQIGGMAIDEVVTIIHQTGSRTMRVEIG